jgi:flagellar biosynthesis/type III secretory pathway protein FliH
VSEPDPEPALEAAELSPPPSAVVPVIPAVEEPMPASRRSPSWTAANEGGPPSLSPPSRRAVPFGAPDPAEIERLHAALIEAIAVGLRARREALAAAERDLVHLALAIAGKVVGREIAADPAVLAGWAREGIAALGEQDRLTVAISPDLAARLPPEAWAQALDGLAPVVDRALPPGGCEVRGAYGRVDAGLGPRLASVAEALEEALPGGAGSEAA